MTLRQVTWSVTLLGMAGLIVSCGGTKRPPAVAMSSGSGAGSVSPDSGYGQPLEPESDIRPLSEEIPEGSDWPGSASPEGGPLADIYFGFDQATLGDQARGTLELHALWLQTHRGARVNVEGHCDERGTVEYNLALGNQRAETVKEYLVSLGVASERLTTVSYGKERAVDHGHDEAAWGRNRRAHFAVTRQGSAQE